MSLPKSVVEKRMKRQLKLIESPTEFPVRRTLGNLFREKGSPADHADSPAQSQSVPSQLQVCSPLNSSATSSSSGSPWQTPGPDLRKNLAMEDYDSSPSLSPQPHSGGQSQGLMSTPSHSPNAVAQPRRSPSVAGGRGGLSPVTGQGSMPDSPVTTGKLVSSGSFRRLLESPVRSPSQGSGPERSLGLKRPSFVACEDENSSDSGYASLPTDDLQSKRYRFKEDPSTKESGLDTWLSGSGNGSTPAGSPLSFKSNTSSLDLDGFPMETISELPEEEEEESSPRAGGFTSLLSNTILMPRSSSSSTSLLSNTILMSQPSSSSTPTLRRSCSMLTPLTQFSPQSPASAAQFKMPSVPVRQAGPITRSMLRSQNEIRKQLVELKEDQPDVLPDGSKKYCLPLPANIELKHPELRSITCHTMAELLTGKYKDRIRRFRIIDCRYEFEFSGGHIKGAENWEHGQEQEFLSSFLPTSALPAQPAWRPESEEAREILIFHCEFSSQRGPDFYRKLRSRDREINAEVFPALHYPECYLLHLGYKEFFKNYPELCTGGYTEMADQRYKKDLRSMRAKSKSWAGGTVSRIGVRKFRKH